MGMVVVGMVVLQLKNPASGVWGGGGQDEAILACAAAREVIKHQIVHGADTGLDALRSLGIAFADLGALSIDAITLLAQFPVRRASIASLGNAHRVTDAGRAKVPPISMMMLAAGRPLLRRVAAMKAQGELRQKSRQSLKEAGCLPVSFVEFFR